MATALARDSERVPHSHPRRRKRSHGAAVATSVDHDDRPHGAAGTRKRPNLLYGMRFARSVIGTWRRERKAARTRLCSEKTQ